jgi:pimeloyl-ACP methyl ester carboxylesterase
MIARNVTLSRYLLICAGVMLVLCVGILGGFRFAAHVREFLTRAQAAPSVGRFVRGGDVEMFIQEVGPAQGPPVLLIHGTGAWGGIWRETMRALAGAGYRAIALDLPPFGFSERPPASRYDDEAQALRILGVLDALNIRSVTLVGHSFGGRPTVEAALRDPTRIRLLVLVDAALDLQVSAGPPARPPLVLRAALWSPMIRDPLVAATVTNPLLTRFLLRRLILDPEDATDAQVRMLQQQLPVAGTTHAVGLWLPSLLGSGERSMNRDRTRYRKLTMPSLLVWGENDAITPLPQGQDLSSLLPDAKLVVLPHTGHIPAIEDATAFNAALLGFLSEHPAAP